ncbi:MAG: N-methyl-L-tryptophan oxidase [Planctomycetaceae bacterium]|nr:N-methyl-L-tryptophan oxidase [Planctomycetaceae bacterium]
MKSVDVIVLGTGGIGSAALWHLAKRGVNVLGIDRFKCPHDKGSTHGQTRLIRMAYYEHPDYVPLLKRGYELWRRLESETGTKLFHQCGILQVSPGEGRVYPGVLESARVHNLKVEALAADEVQTRFPGFRVREPLKAVFEPGAGYLKVDECVSAFIETAQQAGAKIQSGESVISWRPSSKGVEVTTDRGSYSAGHLIISAGSWANDFLADLGIRFEVVRKSLYWYEPKSGIYREGDGGVGFIFETALGNYYGFPQIDENGVKLAEHTGGWPVVDALTINRDEDPQETDRIRSFLRQFLPEVTSTRKKFATCLYTLSPDRRFVVDRHPEFPQVSFVAGLSGHGYKFAAILGEVLADWATSGGTELPVQFLRSNRPELKGKYSTQQ